MDHRRLIPQARHIKQIVLWMDILRPWRNPVFKKNGPLALRDKITVDRWRFNV
jgi:hypothetical protein